MFPTCGAMFKQKFLLLQSETSFTSKDQDNILTLLVPVLWSTKALGGIKVVIDLISSDIILVDHLTLLLMGSTGRHLEVIIS